MKQGVIETATYLAAAARAGMSDDERQAAIDLVSGNPDGGDLIVGTGGARKFRLAGRGKGKSGGYRIIAYWCGVDVPVFLMTVVNKGQRTNLSAADKKALAQLLRTVAADYRATVAAGARKLKTIRLKGKA